MAAHAAPTSMAPVADREVRRGLSSVPVMYDLRFAVSTVSPALVRIAPTVLDRPAPPMIIVPPEDLAEPAKEPPQPGLRRGDPAERQLSRRRKRRPASTFQPIRRLRPRKMPRHQRRPPILRPTNLQPRVLPQQLPLHPALPHPALRPTSKLPASSRRQHRRPKPPPSSRRSASPAPLARLPRRSRTPTGGAQAGRKAPGRKVRAEGEGCCRCQRRALEAHPHRPSHRARQQFVRRQLGVQCVRQPIPIAGATASRCSCSLASWQKLQRHANCLP